MSLTILEASEIIDRLTTRIHELIGTDYRDAAIQAWEGAETARDEARAAAGSAADGVRSELATIQGDTEAARDTALEHRNDAQTARDEAQAAAEHAQAGAPAEGWQRDDLHVDVREDLSRARSALQDVPDATGEARGVIRLAGDLGGSATSPTVPGLSNKSDVGHGHQVDDVDGLGTALAGAGQTAEWSQVTGKPSAFPPDGHGHQVDDVDGLGTALAAAGQTAQWGQVSWKPSVFPPESHRHTADQIDNLDTFVFQRVNALTPDWVQVTGPPSNPQPNTIYFEVE